MKIITLDILKSNFLIIKYLTLIRYFFPNDPQK